MELGPEIKIEGKRPEWLKDDEYIGIVWYDGTRWENLNTAVRNVAGWSGSITAIMLPADHPYYLATSKGFTYWPGGDSAPDDWDEGEVLFRNGEAVCSRLSSWTHPWCGGSGTSEYDVIGYHRKSEQARKYTAKEAEILGLDRWTLAYVGLLLGETEIERFEREHGGLDNNQRDIVAAYIAWKEKRDA